MAETLQLAEAAPGAPGAVGAEAGHGAATEHRTEGLPQFDTSQWAGQAVWFLLIFAFVLLMMRFVFVPRIGGAIFEREGKISSDIDQARRMKDEAASQAELIAAETAKARAETQRLANEARAKAQAGVAARLADEEVRLGAIAAEAERGIAAARGAAMTNLQSIATDTAAAIVEKLTGRAATSQELEAGLAGRP